MSTINSETLIWIIATGFTVTFALMSILLTIMNQRFNRMEDAADKRFCKNEEAVESRFCRFEEAIDKRFTKSEEAIDKRFARFEEAIDKRFNKVETDLKDGFKDLSTQISKLDDKLTDVDRRLCRLEGAFSSKDCCMIKDDRQNRKAE